MRTSFSKLSLLALPLAALTACQDYEPFDEETVRSTMTSREFANNFIERYGEPDPNHTWGFGDIECLNGTNATRGTGDYSGAGHVYVNTNQWAEKDNNGYKHTDLEHLAYSISIPGWPNFDGYYYEFNDHTSTYHAPNNEPNSSHPGGDVTDFEIQYVSRWFRENPNPKSIQLHLTDFFVQNISKDYDRVTYPDGEKVNEIPGNNSPNYGMEHLVFKTMESNSAIDDTWTHMNNYNSGNTNPIGTNILAKNQYAQYQTGTTLYTNSGTNEREIKYVTSSGTEDFGYLSSNDAVGTEPVDGQYYRHWVLVHLEWDEVGQDNKSHHRDGYYLAFDYDTRKEVNGEVVEYKEDGYYSNWIIKISPAHAHELSPTYKRVMCEDLGNTYDFDFNDVVFDVAFQWIDDVDKYEAIIILQAAGGTLPIYVGRTPSDKDGAYEAHHLLIGPSNASSSTPVNVDAAGGKTTGIANYRVSGYTSPNPEEINIYVVNNGVTYTLNSSLDHNLGSNYNDENNNTHTSPNPGIGSNKVPQRFCVPVSVKWMKECKFIEDGYPAFPKWVANETKNTLWYNAIGTSSLIYEYKKLDDHYTYDPDKYVDDNTGEDSSDDFTFNWYEDNPTGGTFTIPASYFANATNKIVITFTGDFEFQFAMPSGENIPYTNDKDGVLTIDNSVAISSLKAGTHNVFNVNYCANPSEMKSNLLSIVCQ